MVVIRAAQGEDDLDALIGDMRPRSEDEIRIAFLGKPESGKSVLTALLKHRLVTSWIPMTNGKMRAAVLSGHEEINEIIRNLKAGKFPLTTSPGDFPRLEMDLEDRRGRATTLKLVMQDMSGEVYHSLLAKGPATHKKRLRDLLTNGAEHVVFATKYVIVADCSIKDSWVGDGASISTLIGTLRYISNRVHGGKNSEKLATKVAVVFTKADLLSTEDQEKPADELAREYPDLLNSLEMYCEEGSYKFFKMHVSSKEETDEEYEIRFKHEVGEQEKKFKKDFKSQSIQNQKSINLETDNIITQAIQDGKSDEAAIKMAEMAESKLQKKFEAKFWATRKYDKPGGKRWLVNKPLQYSENEYDRLISWLLNTDGVWD